MKISIGMNLQPGPWGGGNQFGHALRRQLLKCGARVSFDLSEPDLDLIVLTEPRGELASSAYTHRDIARYLLRRKRRALVVHRINECDERKGTSGLNRFLASANRWADHTVFISGWLRNLFVEQGLAPRSHCIVRNGAERSVFHSEGFTPWDGRGRLRIVTHHWGGGRLKGFDVYERLDAMLAESTWRDRIEFSYVGRLPEGVRLSHARCVAPLHGEALAAELRSHHLYLTASQNEPAGMHHIEGACCGLPLLYRDSGALPEYCQGFGVSFTQESFESRLVTLMDEYNDWVTRTRDYPHSSERMCEQYVGLFQDMLEQRQGILTRRRWLARAPRLAASLLPRLEAGR